MKREEEGGITGQLCVKREEEGGITGTAVCEEGGGGRYHWDSCV